MGNCCSYLSYLFGLSNYEPIFDTTNHDVRDKRESSSITTSSVLKSINVEKQYIQNHNNNNNNNNKSIIPSSSSSLSTTTSSSSSSSSSTTSSSNSNGSIAIPYSTTKESLKGINNNHNNYQQNTVTQVKTGFFITYDLKEEIGVGST